MWQAIIATSLLLGQVSGAVLGHGGLLVRRNPTDEQMRRFAESMVEHVERRQTTYTTSNTTQWDTETMAACITALTTLNGNAGNPSGLAVCYNLPWLDQSTGVFQADLRLFSISPPSGDFANIPPQNVQVGLSYNAASVSAVNTSAMSRRDGLVSLISWPRNLDKREASVPTMVQGYYFVGQIDKDKLNSSLDTAALENLLIPNVTLMGLTSDGTTVTTSLTGSEGNFVNGVFAKAATTVTKAAVPQPLQTLVVASGEPFVLPGTHILIAPIGAIITGVWAALFLATVSYGTVERIRFRDEYRRRRATASKGDYSRF